MQYLFVFNPQLQVIDFFVLTEIDRHVVNMSGIFFGIFFYFILIFILFLFLAIFFGNGILWQIRIVS